MLKEKIFSSTLGQLYNFFVFCASMCLTANNILDMSYNINNSFFYSTNIVVIYDALLILCSFYVMMNSIETPFSINASSKLDESLGSIVYYIALVYSSASTVVEDPNMLFTATFDIINNNFGDKPLNLKIDIFQSGRDEMHRTGLAFLTIVNFSKILLLITSLIYLFSVTTYTKVFISKEMLKSIKKTSIYRLLMFSIITLNLVITFQNINVDKTKLDHLQNSLEVFNSMNASSIASTLIDPKFQSTIEDFAIFSLVIASYYITIFYEHYEYSLFCILALTLQNIVKMDLLLQDDDVFSVMVVTFFISSVILASYGTRLLYENRDSVKQSVNVLPGAIYKFGLILCILSLFFVILAFNYEWFNFRYEPSGISADAANAIEAAADRIDGVVDKLSSVARVLDPCSRRNFEDIPDVKLVNNVDEIEKSLKESRRQAAFSNTNLGVCVSQSDPFNMIDFGSNPPAQCTTFEEQLEDTRNDLIETFNANDEGFKDFDPEADAEDEFFVDQRCAKIKCDVLTGVTTAAIAASFIPFGSAAAAAASMAARAAFRVFRMGRRITRFLPRMIRKKQKVVKLARRIRKLAIATRSTTRFSKQIAVIFLPVILLAGISLTLLMFRRSVRLSSGNQSVAGTNGIKFIVGVFGPVAVVEIFFFIALTIIPEVIQSVLDELPDEFVVGTFEIGVGYTCLKFAYFLSSLGALLSIVGVVILTYNNFIMSLLEKVMKKIKKGRQTRIKTDGHIKYTQILSDNVDRWFNWNPKYFQPLVFSLPSIYWILHALYNQPKYVIITYGSNDDVSRANDELLETSLQRERSEGFDMEFDENACGAVAKLVLVILEAVGGLDAIKNLLSGFTGVLKDAFDGVADFIKSISDLVDIDLFEINIPPFSAILGAFGVLIAFALPIICIVALFYLWYISFTQKFVQVSPNQGDGTVGYGLDGSVAILVFFLSIMNVVGHYIISGLITTVFNTDMPFIKVNAEMGECFFNTQLASLFTLIASISLYVNIILPPE